LGILNQPGVKFMTHSNFSNTATKITLGLAFSVTLFSPSTWAACTGSSMFTGQATCVDTVNNNETGLATLNTNLSTTNANLVTTNNNLATTNNNLATTNSNLATTNANVTAANSAMTAGDTATLASANSYTDSKSASANAATLASANAYTNVKTAEMTQSANTYADKKSAEVVSSAAVFTNEQVQKVDQKTSRGIASTVAMANIPAPSSAGKTFTLGVGIGSYDKQTALAIGGQKRLGENGLARFAVAGSTGGGASVSVGASASWEF
jgi:YadA-like membrane anchor domain